MASYNNRLNNKIKKTVIEYIENINITLLNFDARENKRLLRNLHRQGIIDNSSIENALEKSVLRQAKKDYEIMTKNIKPYTIWADHLNHECLAYALEKNKFLEKEIKQIPFDPGETVEEFIEINGKKNLLSEYRKALLNPRRFPEVKTFFDPHPPGSNSF